jgi:aminoglycoside phosphotransferase family enzyme/predicted kinase
LTDVGEAEVTAWLAGQSDRTVETACARVFLTPSAAFKVKRRIALSYVDFSTPERRLWALERELAFNQAGAPGVYRAIRRVTRAVSGGLEFDGGGEVVEYVLEMRRFDDRDVLAARPEAVDGPMAERLGRAIAGFHAGAPVRPQGGLASMRFTVGSNAGLLRELAPRLGTARVEALIDLTEAELARQAPLLEARTAGGFSRRCHGDLHLGNILVENGHPILFDCIEFNDLLSDVDVQYDLAFLLMDLDFRGRREAAGRILSAYLDEAARSFPHGLWEGLAALPLMLAVRAGVRAHVWAHSGDDGAAMAYVDAGVAHLSPPPARLVAVGGLSGSGKSSFARQIAPGLGASPGAVILRTDEVRKRLMGAAATAVLPPQAYTGEVTARTYDVLLAEAAAMLRAGRTVVLDATFLDPALRGRVARLAADLGVPFEGVWLQAPAEVLEARVAARVGDASDATVQTLRDQLARDPGAMDWTLIDAAAPSAAAAAAWSSRA